MVFKKFSVRHDRVVMKVGTDGVLLGAWAAVEQVRTILDVGTGSGVIALMMAQRTGEDVKVDAVEIADDAAQALENFEASPWSHRLRIFHTSLQRYEPDTKYDLIITNPPYFINSLKPPGERRTLVRHGVALGPADILDAVDRMLAPDGRLSLILPPAEALAFESEARLHNFYPVRQCLFRSRPDKPPKRHLMEFSHRKESTDKSEIILYNFNGLPSAAYRALTQEFYLNF